MCLLILFHYFIGTIVILLSYFRCLIYCIMFTLNYVSVFHVISPGDYIRDQWLPPRRVVDQSVGLAGFTHFSSSSQHQVVISRSPSPVTSIPPIGQESWVLDISPQIATGVWSVRYLGWMRWVLYILTNIYLTNPDADIVQISLGLRHTGASLTHNQAGW